ncbi:Uncharacterized protein TCM_042305 [Theobroma cacao]|uniref:Uncharacterized protein n=1 Tax=Theobroma cacao TaxID=3641 RepID=A0A061GY15_THECC|nr:Uncharacterized protein TCM_042305 [Theobroma cacao]
MEKHLCCYPCHLFVVFKTPFYFTFELYPISYYPSRPFTKLVDNGGFLFQVFSLSRDPSNVILLSLCFIPSNF